MINFGQAFDDQTRPKFGTLALLSFLLEFFTLDGYLVRSKVQNLLQFKVVQMKFTKSLVHNNFRKE